MLKEFRVNVQNTEENVRETEKKGIKLKRKKKIWRDRRKFWNVRICPNADSSKWATLEHLWQIC